MHKLFVSGATLVFVVSITVGLGAASQAQGQRQSEPGQTADSLGVPQISEISPDDAFRDWIEIHNPGSAPQAVGGWELSASNGSTVTLPTETVVAPRSWFVIRSEPAGLPGHFVLPTRNGSLSLSDPASSPTQVDRVRWTAPEGASLVRCVPGTLLLRVAHRATPGRANDCSVRPGSDPSVRPAVGRARVFVPNRRGRTVKVATRTTVRARVRSDGAAPRSFRVRIQGLGRVRATLNERGNRLRIAVPKIARPGHRRVLVRFTSDHHAATSIRFNLVVKKGPVGRG